MALDIEGAAYGHDKSAVKTFIEEQVKVGCLETIKDALDDYEDLFTTLDNNWGGQAEENFKKNFKDTVKNVKNQLDNLFDDLENEINAVNGAMSQMDDDLID